MKGYVSSKEIGTDWVNEHCLTGLEHVILL